MYYISGQVVVNSISALRGKVENKFLGLLGILKAISTDKVMPNFTYRINDGELASWLDNQLYLANYEGTYGSSELYIKFSSQWFQYVRERFIDKTINVNSLLVFLYKYEAFDRELTCQELLLRFCEDYHLSQEVVKQWFVIDEIQLSYDTILFSKVSLKKQLCIPNNTISFDAPYSVKARAGELSRAPFLQTLYAGMDSIKCLLLLRENIDEYYSGKNVVCKAQFTANVASKYRPYITAIKSKPFLLLAGISGTGKSRIVRELARACWDVESPEYTAHKPKNYEMVQVKPNWHDSSELIGYVSRINGEQYVVGPFLRFMVKAILDPNTPYFLCLDEMNLAPVEQYFAEFLSVIESRKQENGKVVTDPIVDYEPTEAYKNLIDQLFDDDEIRAEYLKEKGGKRLSIPQNLIVVGTVNMDETTFSFSRKVLDRAMTIEMNEVNLAGGLTQKHETIGKLNFDDLVGMNVEGVDVYADHLEVCDKAIAYLQKINDVLECTPFKVAYRTRNEFLLYVVNNLPYRKDEDGNELSEEEVVARALDEITSMKVLSRIEGDDQKVKEELLARLEQAVTDMLPETLHEKSVSLAKLKEMKERCKTGFTSFWS